jgi:endonuclease/exonuclease/phosphatase (EEP) superfamily protein YafD
VPRPESAATARRPWAFAFTLLVGACLALLLVWPQAYGAQRAPVVSQLISFRIVLALGFGALALAAGLVAGLRRRWAVAAGIAVVALVAGVANAAVVLSRGAGVAAPEASALTVVAWNTQGGAASPDAIARLVLETGADVVSLPETGEEAAAQVVGILSSRGVDMVADTTYGPTGESPIPTSVLLAAGLGEYRLDATAGSTPGLPSGVWRPVDGDAPTVVAAHPMPPLPGTQGVWQSGLEWVGRQCAGGDVIVAGDLNATLDHLQGVAGGDALIGQCRDAALEAGGAARGSWPATVPAWIAAPIDHVLVGPGWSVRSAGVVETFDDAGSDHRPVVAVLEAR